MHSRSFFDVSLRWGSRKKILHASSQKLERSLGRSTQTARVETIKPLQSPESQTRSTNQSKGSSTLRQGSLRERVLRTGRVLQIREGVVWSDKSAVITSTRESDARESSEKSAASDQKSPQDTRTSYPSSNIDFRF